MDENFSTWTVANLKKKLKELSLPTSGLKNELVARITEHYEKTNISQESHSEEKNDESAPQQTEAIEENNSDTLIELKNVTISDKDSQADSKLENGYIHQNGQEGDSSISKKNRNKRKKQKRMEKRMAKNQVMQDSTVEEQKEVPEVEIEYVPAAIKVEGQFADIFKYFETGGNNPNLEEEDVELNEEGEEQENNAQQAPQKLSKKKLRRMNRMSVADLKTKVKHPEVVEWVDVTAPNPILLVELKSCRNTVPVPIHWCQKRKYLQGKRGIEKPPFELPAFIKATGIIEVRQATRDREASQKLKAKMREKIRPKLGKLDIDYQKLHDAFFKYQTKPNMSIHGDLYYEGKEYEIKYKNKRPGNLSDELKAALNMPPGAPPPWLINMQRYGPPPAYPYLKIPGLNAPIPPGAQWGFHPGGWGKPPVDEYNRPLYGDVFGVLASTAPAPLPITERVCWGDLQDIEEEEEEQEEIMDEEDEDEEEENVATGLINQAIQEDGEETFVSAPIESISYVEPDENKVPDVVPLRKEIKPDFSNEKKELYTILPQKETKITGMMGSTHVYDISAKRKHEDYEMEAADAPTPLEKDQVEKKKPKKETSKKKDFKF